METIELHAQKLYALLQYCYKIYYILCFFFNLQCCYNVSNHVYFVFLCL